VTIRFSASRKKSAIAPALVHERITGVAFHKKLRSGKRSGIFVMRSSGIEKVGEKYHTPILGRDALVGLVELQTQAMRKLHS
jgi:hypothetical protein